MLLTVSIALTLTVAITAYAASRGRSPGVWGGASALVTVVSVGAAWVLVQDMGASELVFADHGGALAMLGALAGPVMALVGNGLLASRLAALPSVRVNKGSSWMMWRVGEADVEGYACRLTATAEGILATRAAEQDFMIPHAELAAVEINGETLVLCVAGGRRLRLVLAQGDTNDRESRIHELASIKRAIEDFGQASARDQKI